MTQQTVLTDLGTDSTPRLDWQSREAESERLTARHWRILMFVILAVLAAGALVAYAQG